MTYAVTGVRAGTGPAPTFAAYLLHGLVPLPLCLSLGGIGLQDKLNISVLQKLLGFENLSGMI